MTYTAMDLLASPVLYGVSLFGGWAQYVLLGLSVQGFSWSTFQEFLTGTHWITLIPFTVSIWLAAWFLCRRRQAIAILYGVSGLVVLLAEYTGWRLEVQQCRTSDTTHFDDFLSLFVDNLGWCDLFTPEKNWVGLLVRMFIFWRVINFNSFLAILLAKLLVKSERVDTEFGFSMGHRVSMMWQDLVTTCDSFLTGGFDKKMGVVYSNKTPNFQVRVPEPKETLLKAKLVLSTDDNIGMTRAILESAFPGNPLRQVDSSTGNVVKRMLKSQVYLSAQSGRLAGMGTLIRTSNGQMRILTLGHVIEACNKVNSSILITSASTNKALVLQSITITRVTSFKVGDVTDHRVEFKVDNNLQSRLGLVAANVTTTFQPCHALVYSPPEKTGSNVRYCTGRVNRFGSNGLITFDGSTLPGTSGAGVFVDGKVISVHVGSLKEEDNPEGFNISFGNFPRRGKPINQEDRKRFAQSQGIVLESAAPELRVFDLVDFLDIFAEDGDTYEVEDIDLDDDVGYYTRYNTRGSSYMETEFTELDDPMGAKVQSNILAMLRNKSGKVMWGFMDSDDDSDDGAPRVSRKRDADDQAHLQDEYEAQGTADEGRVGRRGTTKIQVRSTGKSVRLETVDEIPNSGELSIVQLERQRIVAEINRLKVIRAARNKEQGQLRELETLREQLKLLRSALNLDEEDPSVVKLENADSVSSGGSIDSDDSEDFGRGERLPRNTAASAVSAPSLRDSQSLELPLDTPMGTSKVGSKPPPVASSQQKKAKRKKKTKPANESSSGGGDVPESQAVTSENLASLTSLLASLTQRLGDMERQIAALPQPNAP